MNAPDAALLLAFSAGLLAAFNPCGFALLPAYLGMFLADRRGGRAVTRALGVGGTVTMGFVVTFGVAGLAVSALSLRFGQWISALTALLGVLLVVAGLVLLAGKKVSVRFPRASSRSRLALGHVLVRDHLRHRLAFVHLAGVHGRGCHLFHRQRVVATGHWSVPRLRAGDGLGAHCAGPGDGAFPRPSGIRDAPHHPTHRSHLGRLPAGCRGVRDLVRLRGVPLVPGRAGDHWADCLGGRRLGRGVKHGQRHPPLRIPAGPGNGRGRCVVGHSPKHPHA